MTNAKYSKAAAVRMVDVARAAGVSPITVSRALRAPESVAPDTLERIIQAVRQTGYVPNNVAGNLRANRTNLVVAIIPSISHQFLSSMIQGMSDVLSGAGMNLMLGTSRESLAGEEGVVAAFLAQRPCGIILHNTAHTTECRELLKRARIPVVETGDLIQDPIDVSVGYSNYRAAEAMTLHLIERGYRQIAFVSGELSNERASERRRGYRAALQQRGMAERADLMLEAAPGLSSGAATLRQLLQRRPKIDAIFFAGDTLAAGAILECQKRGIKVPQDIAIAGYDDSELALQVTPSLTALRIPRYEIGQRAAQVLLQSLHAPLEAGPIDLGFEIVGRAST